MASFVLFRRLIALFALLVDAGRFAIGVWQCISFDLNPI